MNYMNFVDPSQFVIRRKRKKYRFALFHNSPICFEFDEWTSRQRQLRADVVEIGAGDGLFMVKLAAQYPNRVFVAVDVKGDRLQRGASEAQARGLSNVFFVRARADQAKELFTAHSISEIWLTFSDPFPKKRSSRRRLTHPYFLDIYKHLLHSDGYLQLKHDNSAFFQWSLEQLVAERWQVVELSFNLHESDLSDDYKIITTYEQRWLEDGRITQFASSRPPHVKQVR